jgi:hypothetical protein
LLLITTAFPPDQSTGSLRWQKLAAHVAEQGWGLDVVTVDPSCVESADPSGLAELPPGTRVYGVRTIVPWIERVGFVGWKTVRWLRSHRGRRTATVDATTNPRSVTAGSFRPSEMQWPWRGPRELVRAYHAWLDYARFGRWAREAATVARQLIEPSVHEAIITSGPPHMAHEAGRLVSRETGVPFVMDMRDPWSLVQRLPGELASPLWLRLAAFHERRAVARAALIVANTEPFRRAMCDRYPEARSRVITVMNGCDADPLPPSRHGEGFVLAYAGDIYLDRDPRLLFRAAAHTIREFGLEPADFRIEFLGGVERYGSTLVSEIAREEGIERFVTLEPKRPRREALDFLARATMLVSLPQDSDMAIPAKIFEYVRFDAWVLALATHNSASGTLLRGSGADVVPPDDLDGLVKVLRERVAQFRNGVRPRRIARDGRFSRRVQAQRLLDAIVACTRRPSATRALDSRRQA